MSIKQKLKVYKKTVSIVGEPTISLYDAYVGKDIGFLLESYDKNNGRYSIFGKNPEALISSTPEGLQIKHQDGTTTFQKGNPLQLLKEFYDTFDVELADSELAFQGGFLGSLGYDFVRYEEELPDNNPDEIGIETIQLMLARQFIVIDQHEETFTGVMIAERTPEGEKKAMAAIEAMISETLNGCHAAMEAGITEKPFVHDGKIIHKSDTLEQYSEKVNKIKEYIKEGHIFQTVLSQRWTIETSQEGFQLYKELRISNPSPYLYYFNFGDFEIIGSSPEMIVKEQERHIYTCPIAGTRPRGKTEEEDLRLRNELLSDKKELAEHVMLVDLARNDMGRVSEFGSVKVTQFMQVQNYSHVMHIVSLVEGRQKGKHHPFDLISSFLPAGTLSGAPKIRAMEIIDELETVRRGLYGGATGYLDFSGNMDFCITIRTMIKKGNKVYLQAGAGIVLDSVPETEYTECCNKVMALAKTLVEEENL